MRVTKYILALVVGSLALLSDARLNVAAVQAETDPAVTRPLERNRRVVAKQRPKQPVQLDIKAVVTPPVSSYVAVPVPMPAREGSTPAKKGPHLDIEGLVIGDMHVQPNLLFNTDTRYDNSTTRERAQRDDQDFMSARQHGDSTRGPDPVGELIRTKLQGPPTPASNDPGYDVAVAVRDQVNVMPPKPESAPAPAPAPVATSRVTSRAAQKAAAAKLAKR